MFFTTPCPHPPPPTRHKLADLIHQLSHVTKQNYLTAPAISLGGKYHRTYLLLNGCFSLLPPLSKKKRSNWKISSFSPLISDSTGTLLSSRNCLMLSKLKTNYYFLNNCTIEEQKSGLQISFWYIKCEIGKWAGMDSCPSHLIWSAPSRWRQDSLKLELHLIAFTFHNPKRSQSPNMTLLKSEMTLLQSCCYYPSH